jgi:hypothetical protein
MGKGQISRALAGLVSRKLVSRTVNPGDHLGITGRYLSASPRTRLAAHDAIVAGPLEPNQRLLEQLDMAEVAMLLGHIDRLTDTAAKMLEAEKDLA